MSKAPQSFFNVTKCDSLLLLTLPAPPFKSDSKFAFNTTESLLHVIKSTVEFSNNWQIATPWSCKRQGVFFKFELLCKKLITFLPSERVYSTGFWRFFGFFSKMNMERSNFTRTGRCRENQALCNLII